MNSFSLLLSGTALAGCLATWPAAAKELDTQPIAADVEILRGILATALGTDGKRRHDWFGDEQIGSWYLARQGVVFRVDTDALRSQGGLSRRIEIHQDAMESSWEAASEAMESAMESLRERGMGVDLPEAPEVPEPAMAYAFSTDDEAAGGAAERKALRERAEAVRAKSRALRDKLRELRKLPRDDKNAAARARLEGEITALKDELKAERDRQREQIAAQKLKAEAEWDKTLSGLETKLVTALCNYGGSLKSVPKEEHVTLILGDAVKGEDGRQDLYYVFTRKELSDCQAERLSAVQLKDKALRYSY